MEKQAIIDDLIINYNVVHRDIKYPRLEFKTGKLLIVLPKKCDNHGAVIEKHKNWIYKRYYEITTALKKSQEKSLHCESLYQENEIQMGEL